MTAKLLKIIKTNKEIVPTDVMMCNILRRLKRGEHIQCTALSISFEKFDMLCDITKTGSLRDKRFSIITYNNTKRTVIERIK